MQIAAQVTMHRDYLLLYRIHDCIYLSTGHPMLCYVMYMYVHYELYVAAHM